MCPVQSVTYVSGRSEDCQVCCKPNLLHVTYDSEAHAFFIDADLE
jgi:Cysteine-rich CPXCG